MNVKWRLAAAGTGVVAMAALLGGGAVLAQEDGTATPSATETPGDEATPDATEEATPTDGNGDSRSEKDCPGEDRASGSGV
jgi:hypothetical protein